VGEMVAKRAKSNKIKTIIFDRGIYPYHGRVKTLAEAMRKGGLSF
jgi:large subunit ribosomal protein L18